MKPIHPLPRRVCGFTLIELMIVVAIVAILASVAYPSYQSYVQKTRRAAAAGCMMELAQWMERNYTTCLRYDMTGANCGTAVTTAQLPALSCRTDLGNTYTLQFAPGFPTTTAYTLEAIPGAAQAGDVRCGTLRLDQAGGKTVSGTGGRAACW
jgi:type IV pilus assembly protein PilE